MILDLLLVHTLKNIQFVITIHLRRGICDVLHLNILYIFIQFLKQL